METRQSSAPADLAILIAFAARSYSSCFIVILLCSALGPADGQRFDQATRLAEPDGGGLPVLAAGPRPALVELEIIGQHGDVGQHLGAVAHDVDVFDRSAELPVFNQASLGDVEG